MNRVWLASYPKSGSTWLRMMIGSLSATDERPLDINDPPEPLPVVSVREIIEDATLIDTTLLTHDEADPLRSRLYGAALDLYDEPGPSPRFYKVHDAYRVTPAGDPVLGRATARAAILIVRDPRDVALSLAAHFERDVDWAIAFMGREDAALRGEANDRHRSFRQSLLTWSLHAASWLEQTEMPVHVVRYESLQAEPARVFFDAMTFAGRAISLEDARRAAAAASFANLQRQERDRGFVEGTERGSFFRHGRSGSWRHALTEGQARRIEADHRSVMRLFGYDSDPGAPLAEQAESVPLSGRSPRH